MKIKTLILLAVIMMIVSFSVSSYGDDSGLKITSGEDWSWESEAFNMIEGEIDLSEYNGQELTVRLSTDLPYENEEEQQARKPVFVTVNGKRITVKKQSDTTRCKPSADEPDLRFTARFSLPEKKRVYSVRFNFTVTDENGRELKILTGEIDGVKAGTGSVFYLSADINKISIIIWIAAAAVWVAVLIRTGYAKKRRGEKNLHADL